MRAMVLHGKAQGETISTTPLEAGWYTDPWYLYQLRWWDGRRWQADTHMHPVWRAKLARQRRIAMILGVVGAVVTLKTMLLFLPVLVVGIALYFVGESRGRATRKAESFHAELARRCFYGDGNATDLSRLAAFRGLGNLLPPGNPFWEGNTCHRQYATAAICPIAELTAARHELRNAAWTEFGMWEALTRRDDPQRWSAYVSWKSQQAIIARQNALLAQQAEMLDVQRRMADQNDVIIDQHDSMIRKMDRIIR
jgi:hypothetical protein